MNIKIEFKDFRTVTVLGITSLHSKESMREYLDTLVVTDHNGDEKEYGQVRRVEVYV